MIRTVDRPLTAGLDLTAAPRLKLVSVCVAREAYFKHTPQPSIIDLSGLMVRTAGEPTEYCTVLNLLPLGSEHHSRNDTRSRLHPVYEFLSVVNSGGGREAWYGRIP